MAALVCGAPLAFHARTVLDPNRTMPWDSLLLAGCVLSILLAAFQLIPTLELVGLSVGKYRLDWRGTGDGIPWEAFVSLVWPDFYHVSDLSRFTLPTDVTFSYLFSGFIPIWFALYGLCRRDVSWRAGAVWWSLAAISAVLMLGDRTPVGVFVWRMIPPMIRVSYYPQYWIPVFSLGIALAGAHGLDHWRQARPALRWLIPCLTAAELIYFNASLPMSSAPYELRNRIVEGSYEGDRITPSRLMAGEPASRFDIVQAGQQQLQQQWVTSAALMGRPSANGYDPLAIERLIQCRLLLAKGNRWGAFYPVEQPEAPMLIAMNVDRLISPEALGMALGPDSDWVLLGDSPRYVYARRQPTSRAFFASSVVRAKTMKEALETMRNEPGWDARRQVVIEEPDNGPRITSSTAAGGQVKMTAYQPGEIRLRTSNTATGFLYVSEAFFPGWKATVDGGAPVDVRPANVGFQGTWVPAGEHTVVFRYDPATFRWAALVSLAAGGLAIALVWRGRAGL